MAKTIVEKHGLNEKQAAELLGLSQSAVSRYVGKRKRKPARNRKLN